MGKKYAVVLAGAGSKDGSEIQESVSALIAIAKSGGSYHIFAPNINQREVINHITDVKMAETRNIMIEASRIARGNISPLEDLDVEDFDGLIFPGGFGTAKNLFTFAYDSLDFTVLPEIEKVILDFNRAGKPVGAMCISPVMIAKVLGDKGVKVTLGPESPLCEALKSKFGAEVKSVKADDALVDSKNKVVTTPCYMYGNSNIANVAVGAEKMIKEMNRL